MARRKPPETFEALLDTMAPGDSLTVLAQRLGVTAKTLYNLRNGATDRPTRGTVAILAQGLGVTPDRVRAAIAASRALRSPPA